MGAISLNTMFVKGNGKENLKRSTKNASSDAWGRERERERDTAQGGVILVCSQVQSTGELERHTLTAYACIGKTVKHRHIELMICRL